MELEEMKSLWGEISAEVEKQKKLTDQLILKMIRLNFRNKINKILIPELSGSVVALAAVVFIMLRFQKLNTWYLQAAGVVAAFILIILPVLSILSIHGLLSVNISAKNYKDTLFAWNKGRKRWVLAQKLGFYLGAILMAVILPVMVRLMDGKDVFLEPRIWLCYALSLPFFLFFTRWVFRKYLKMTADAENTLNELEA
jgi:hypothetical protein